MGHRVLSMVVALFVGVYVARYLGPERFGLLSYAMSFVGLFTALATLGLDGIMVRELVKTPVRRDELLGTAFRLKAGGAILMWIGIAAAIPFTHNDTQTNILIAIIAFGVIFQAFNVIDFNYQAEVKSKYVVYTQLVQLVVSSITKLVFVWISAPLVWFACVFLFDGVVHAVGLTTMYLKNTGRIWYWKWQWETAKELLRDSWPLILSGMVISIYMKIDQVMIKEMLGAEQVGHYAAAVRLSEAWYFVPIVVTGSLFPAIINAKKVSEELYYQRLQKLYSLMIWVALAIALPMTFLSDWVIRLLYGEVYEDSAGVLMVHVWSLIPVVFGVVLGRFYIVENLNIDNLARNVTGAIINVILNIFMISWYGIIGAAFSSLISYFYISVIYALIRKHSRRNFRCMLRSIIFSK
ncbi:MAG: flippase [Desulfobacteraceae bacterium]|nr:flippase [Desulfobacteraceae bacterium]MBC2720687.1 flippase [Desulfobacteraceae bacterium]